MSFEEINQQTKLYKIILQNHYDDFTKYYIAEITYDDFSCKVDIAYRIEHGIFPQMDKRMAYNLPQVITEVGRELMQAIDEAYQDEETDLSPYSQNVKLYKKIMQACYNQFIDNYHGDLEFEEYCCKIDIKYRIEHECFPHDDEYQMAARLMVCAINFGKEQIATLDKSIDEVMYSDMIEAAADTLWDCINEFLNTPFHQFISEEHGYASSRRFPRKFIFDDSVLSSLEPYNTDNPREVVEEAFSWLKKKRYVRIVEKGAKSKYDICELVDV